MNRHRGWAREDGSERPFKTLIHLLQWRADHQASRLAYRFLVDGEHEETSVRYGELQQQAQAIGAWLQKQVSAPGQPILLLYAPGLEFIAAFYGCLYGGMIAVPAYPPHPRRRTATSARLEAIIDNASPAAILTTSDLFPVVKPLAARRSTEPNRRVLATETVLRSLPTAASHSQRDTLGHEWRFPNVDASSVAMLQYTSGSTGTPHGVMLSHGNLLHNSEHIRRRFEHTQNSRGLIWLPPYHDMGLIGGILQPLYTGFPVTLMSPLHFLQQPVRWLRAITHTRATTSGGPDFAFALCADRIAPEDCAGLDLSSWDVAFTGAEPVRADTLDRFVATFAPYGFRRQALYPCYGLAEATLMVSGGPKAAPPVLKRVHAAWLTHGQAAPQAAPTRAVQTLVGCGTSVLQQEIVIVDPDTRTRCHPGTVGEIWVRGPSVAQGYWGRPAATDQTFGALLADTAEGPFLRTGDLGFLHGEELFVTGRLKDVIILDGQNHYPQDIEHTVEHCHPALRSGGCAAFSIQRGDTEQLVIVAEVERVYWSDRSQGRDRRSVFQSLGKTVRRAVSEQHAVYVADIRLVKPASLAKTPSGKLQRHACRAAFLSGTLQELRVEDGDARTASSCDDV